MEGVLWSLFGVVALVFANGFFVAAEFALVTVRKTRIEQLETEGVAGAKYVNRALVNLDRYIAGTQVGITIASIALGWIGEPAIVRLLFPIFNYFSLNLSASAMHNIAIGIAFTLITFLHVILGELVPKSLALQKPEAISFVVARPMAFVIWLLQPLIWSLNGLGNQLLRLLGLETHGEHGSVHSTAELELLIRQSYKAGHLDELERKMLQKTFRFSETTVGEVMVQRSEVQGLNLALPQDEILNYAANAKFSRLPVFEGSIDNILGIVYIHDLFRLSRQPNLKLNVKSLIRKALFVPESSHLDGLLTRFHKEHTQMAVVVDEHGGTAGILTFEDVVETIFGEFQDHNEDPTPGITVAGDGTITIRGDTRLDDLNEALEWQLKDERSDTIAGFIMTSLGSVGRVGDEVHTEYGTIRVTAMERLKITLVKIIPHQKIGHSKMEHH